jgi:hypothetical protein
MNDVRELNCLDLEAVSAGAPKQPAAPAPAGTETPRSGFIASVVAWKRRVGMPVLIPGY